MVTLKIITMMCFTLQLCRGGRGRRQLPAQPSFVHCRRRLEPSLSSLPMTITQTAFSIDTGSLVPLSNRLDSSSYRSTLQAGRKRFPIPATSRLLSSRTALMSAMAENNNDNENNESQSKRSNNSTPERRVDDYDSMFFVPATPKKPLGGSQPVASSSYGGDGSSGRKSFFDEDYEENSNGESYGESASRNAANTQSMREPSAPRPRATSAPTISDMQQQNEETQPSFFDEPTNQPQYSNMQRGQHNQSQSVQRQQPQSEGPSSAILSTRALYQFRPIQPGSTRQMPPTISDYDDESYDYIVGDENGESMSNAVVDSDVDDYPVDMDEDSMDVGPTKRTARVTAKNVQNEESSFKRAMESRTLDPFISDATEDMPQSSEQSDPPKQAMASSAPSYPRAMPRVTPSFLEPVKTKAIIGTNDNHPENGSSSQRKLPLEASNGNSGTTHLASLTHQLEHLTSQIYQLNDGVEFNVNSPKQVAKVLFGENNTGDTSTNKDVLEAMASAGNEMAACIYKYRKLSREIKREGRRIEQLEKGDKKNDYYGNLARQDARNSRNGGGSNTTSGIDGGNQSTNNADVKIYGSVTPSSSQQTLPDNAVQKGRDRREPLLLIDASAYIFRAYHAIPPLHRSDGMPTGALHGVCRMLQNLLLTRLLKEEQPRVVLAFDFKGPNFRHHVYPEYKANRGPCPEDLVPQFDLVREAAEAFGVVQVEAEGYEADDVIATLARRALKDGVDVDILSGDKDLMQLITPPGIEPSVHMIDPMHFDRVDHHDVVKKWGVSSEKLGDVLALAGDSSDNIPGAPGIGPKIAATLITEYGTLSNLIDKADMIKQTKRRESLIENAEKVMLFRKLVTLDDSIPTDKMTLPSAYQDVSSLRMTPFNPNRLIDFYKRMELNSCQTQLESRLRSSWVNFKQPPSQEELDGVPF